MLIFRKKRIVFLTLISVLAIVLMICTTLIVAKRKNAEKAILTAATPSSNKVVIIDAGHRTEKIGGAVSKNGVIEADINLKIALKLQNILEQNGTTVVLTRSNEKAIYDEGTKTLRKKKVSDMRKQSENRQQFKCGYIYFNTSKQNTAGKILWMAMLLQRKR